jgi:hydroxypyruvate reductase
VSADYWLQLLRRSFDAAVSSANPAIIIPSHLPPPPTGKLIIVGAGKAAAGMAQAVEAHYSPSVSLSGAIIIPHGTPAPQFARIDILRGAHPLPDNASAQSTQRLIHEITQASADDFVLALVSGGGSSLLGAPLDGLSLKDSRHVIYQLLQAGADVRDINIVRRHLSVALGGRLAAMCRAPILALIISDVVGDAPADIASGPFSGDISTCADALAVLSAHNVDCPPTLVTMFADGTAETPTGHFIYVENRIIAGAEQALAAGAETLRRGGVQTVINWGEHAGDAHELAMTHKQKLLAVQSEPHPIALISGGEATVNVIGGGRGGRNTEFALSLWRENVATHVLSCDTDGIDGQQTAAGAMFGPQEQRRAVEMKLLAEGYLADNNSGDFFARLDTLINTGPTGVNVNDYRVCLLI